MQNECFSINPHTHALTELGPKNIKIFPQNKHPNKIFFFISVKINRNNL